MNYLRVLADAVPEDIPIPFWQSYAGHALLIALLGFTLIYGYYWNKTSKNTENIFQKHYAYFALPFIGTIPQLTTYSLYGSKIQFAVQYFRFSMIIFGVLVWSISDRDKKRLLYYLALSLILMGFNTYATATSASLIHT